MTLIVSRFAGVQLAIKAGPDLIRRLAEATRHDGNPSMDGWMLEMWFFASLRHGGVQLFEIDGREFQTWPESNVLTLDVTCFPALPENNGVWFKPKKWNQGGFDAIFINKSKGLVKFVQVTSGDSHSFKIEYFNNFLKEQGKSPSSFNVTNLEILFLVDEAKKLTFKLAPPSRRGMLKKYGWKSGEEKDKVKIVFIKG